MADYDTAVLLSTFEPYLGAHHEALQHALQRAARLVVLLGSARAARSLRHPWSAAERSTMIRANLSPADNARVDIHPLPDRLYDQPCWLAQVQAAMDELAPGATRVLQVGRAGGRGLLPGWDYAGVMAVPAVGFLALRGALFGGETTTPPLSALAPAPTLDMLRGWETSDWFATLEREYAYIRDFRHSWSVAPYPPVLVTTDALVLHRGHLLLIERGREPGKGLWALPGGFVDQDETLLESCLRELHEETGLDLRGAGQAPVCQQTFDAPHRSMRGRTITHVFRFDLNGEERPAIAGGDDASHAHWFPLAQFFAMEERVFEDHYHIARALIG